MEGREQDVIQTNDGVISTETDQGQARPCDTETTIKVLSSLTDEQAQGDGEGDVSCATTTDSTLDNKASTKDSSNNSQEKFPCIENEDNTLQKEIRVTNSEVTQELYTSLKDEMLKQRSKGTIKSFSWKCFGLHNRSKENKVQKTDNRLSLSHYGIQEEVLDSRVGEWVLVDLNTNLYEKQQAGEIAFLRERNCKKGFFKICCCSLLR